MSRAHYLLLLLLVCATTGDNQIDDALLESSATTITVLNISTHQLTANLETNVSVPCFAKPPTAALWWTYQDLNITADDIKYTVVSVPSEENENLVSHSVLNVLEVDVHDIGNYTCNSAGNDDGTGVSATFYLNVTIPGEVIAKKETVRLKIDGQDTLYCLFRGLPLTGFHWVKQNDPSSLQELAPLSTVTVLNETLVNFTLNVVGINRKNNGTYHCVARDAQHQVSSAVALLVLDTPQVQIDFVKAVGAHMVFLNWTASDGNDPILTYQVQLMKRGTEAWTFYQEEIGGGNKSYLLRNLEVSTEYKLRLAARNGQGTGRFVETAQWVRTLDADPDFVPEININGNTFNSITIWWSQPPPELADHVHYYQLVASAGGARKEAVQEAKAMNLYLFEYLEAATTYSFQVRACNEYTKQCGRYSQLVNGTTMDGTSGPPEHVQVQCRFDNISQTSFVFVQWEQPRKPNGKITHYNVELKGASEFRGPRGPERRTFGPKVKSVAVNTHSARFEMIPANFNYTVDISAVTRTKKHGERTLVNCTMPPTVPDKEHLAHFHWTKLEEHGRFVFKLAVPRISEQAGAICCYRVMLVRLRPGQTEMELPAPDELPLRSYRQVHDNTSGGAYVAEMFTGDAHLTSVFLGDGFTLNSSSTGCLHCTGLRAILTTTTTTTTVPSTTESSSPEPSTTTGSSLLLNRIRRSDNIVLVRVDEANADIADPRVAYDGPLDENSNYTAFVEIIVWGAQPGQTLAAYTHYMELQRPASDFIYLLAANDTGFEPLLIAQLLCGALLVMLIFIPSVCLLHRYTKQVARAQGAEMITLRNSFRQLCRSLRGRHQLVSSHPPNIPPISKAELFDAYVERHRDSDYGFQQEFEQLPDRFPDRTTRASDARENIYKNRYPDIKAYDQTRVRLSQVDSVAGSDYINANFVLGYKERKKFICAQGPMENTVVDYWRMIWEQRLELIMMLTNLEEYSKSKCAKYWPDKSEGAKNFGDMSVSHLGETRYSDYIVRELRVSRAGEERTVTQYHFLVWKDFMAPEHPHGILKFIKRMNEAHSLERGPVLVHCSAGVGRTGTLVALDSLLQQLHEEQQVTIFNTICDLRHQRNFLVQSLKQYIFVYRALMEIAQYGDTEIPASRLRSSIKNLKKCEKEKSGMLEEYEKLKAVLEDRKAFSVGTADENRPKNRSELVIPYDRNRVILTPIPGHEHSTYINASFIEGYDNCESFIITQDPLDATIPDFWRMLSEQGVNIVVMLSDLGSESSKKCPRYWPDDEVNHEHIRVKYIQSESCPYYTRRELSVTNRKLADEVVLVTQLQYHGWPTVEGEVPEVTRGLLELADQVQALQAASTSERPPPVVVHCAHGSDRSSMFVDLCILIQQLRVEKRVDVFTTTRKLRSQRSCMINTFAQYEFLYRAILNYADLHHLCEEASSGDS